MKSAIVFVVSLVLAMASEKVVVDMYSEALWPGCEDYVTTEVAKAMDAVGDIFDFNLFPYGNARETQNSDGTWEFSCQHGAGECVANLIEVCAMHYHNASSSAWFPFINCMESSSNPAKAGSSCATQAGWTDYDTNIVPCTTSALGNGLMHAVAMATDGLSPAHQWTPWIVLNGKPLSESAMDTALVTLICDAYTGPKPAACSKFQSRKLCMREA